MRQLKKVTTILALLGLCITGTARTYFVAPTGGSDTNPGTIDRPWATWQKAFNSAIAGDTVYFRGGVWYPTSKTVQGYPVTIIAPGSGFGHNGTYDNPIVFMAYPDDYESGNIPVLDCWNASQSTTGNVGLNIDKARYLKFKGLTIRNVRMLNDHDNCVGIGMTDCTGYMSFENVVTHNIGGAGQWYRGFDTLFLKNCDSFNCCDSLDASSPGGDGDGFVISARGNATDTYKIAYVHGCRAWHVSDDGFDIGSTKQLRIDNCWAWGNGRFRYSDGYDGDGYGFKLSFSVILEDGKRWLNNCLSSYNEVGFGDVNLHIDDYYGPRMYYYNNTSYGDYMPFMSGPGAFDCQTDPAHVIYRNNIAFSYSFSQPGNFNTCSGIVPPYITADHNTWRLGSYNLAVTNTEYNVTREDFVSLDTAQLRWSRKKDGSLPDITFMKLKAGSDLVDTGTDISLPYFGANPDLGYSEYTSGSPTPPTPAYLSSVIQNDSPSHLELSFTLELANIIPAASAFSVRVNSTARTVSSVAVSGTKVTLTLPSPVVYGDAVTVAYTKPSINPLQTSAGGQAASFSAKTVTNNVTTPLPVYVNSVIDNTSPSALVMTYNLSLANIVPAASAFSVRVNSTARTVSSVAVSGTKVTLTLASPVVYGDAITVAYTKPSINPLQTSAGGQAASFTARSVINNCTPPENKKHAVSISSPIKSESFTAPAEITIDAIASDPDGSIVKVEFYNGTNKLGEKASYPYFFVWKNVPEGTYSLKAIATDNLNARTESEAVQVVVQKSTETVNQLPVVTLISPIHGKKYYKNDEIVIIAEAFDNDGTINSIEIKNEESTLAYLTETPYVYIWESIDTGRYVLTAIATDNRGAKSTSLPLDFMVEKSPGIGLIRIYPNPNDGHFTVDQFTVPDASNSRLEITNIMGNSIRSVEVNADENYKEMDLSNLPSGTYIIKHSHGSLVLASGKFIVL
ncbi:MAG: T9SS type A sorting domain-containing protein [Clostridiaceae bacterium]|nr:T9SS type A sorting domain-containing protein [Clostridiaceae bacterium]